VIPNGIDLGVYREDPATDRLESLGIPAELTYVLFVGRITRQKGLVHLLRAAEHLPPEVGLVLCAGAPDTADIGRETEAMVADLQRRRSNVHWIREMVSRPTAVQLYSHAAVFCCPSIYEPFGIINLEAMACRTAVVASAVGGIKEVVRHGETGLLVPFAEGAEPSHEPDAPEAFAEDLAEALTSLLRDEDRRRLMGEAGRRRAEQLYSWSAIAEQTHELYRNLLKRVGGQA
jgi:glycosyltransferase involved in cell wall biosynthesis